MQGRALAFLHCSFGNTHCIYFLAIIHLMSWIFLSLHLTYFTGYCQDNIQHVLTACMHPYSSSSQTLCESENCCLVLMWGRTRMWGCPNNAIVVVALWASKKFLTHLSWKLIVPLQLSSDLQLELIFGFQLAITAALLGTHFWVTP